MALYTASQSGDWGSATTWGGAGVPGDGDTISIPVAYDVTVSSPQVVGRSSDDGGIDGAVEGSIVIVNGGQLNARGNFQSVGAAGNRYHLDLSQGGIFLWDSTKAAAPGTTRYAWEVGVGTDKNSRIRASGIESQRCVIGFEAGGTKGRFFSTGNRGCTCFLTYCNVDLGGPGPNDYGIDTSSNASSIMEYCRWNQASAGGGVRFNSTISPGFHVRWTGNNFRNTVTTYSLFFQRSTVDGGIDNYITDSAFDGRLWINTYRDLTFQGNVCAGGIVFLHGGNIAMCADNLFDAYQAQGFETPRPGMSHCICSTRLNGNNQHYVDIGGCPQGDYTLADLVFDGDYTTSNGDVILANQGLEGSGGTVTVQNCLTVPNADGRNSPGVVTMHGNAVTNFILRHNTFANKLTNIGENYAGHVDQLQFCQSNLVWGPGDVTQRFVIEALQQTQDHVAAANVTNNGKFQLEVGSNGLGYNNMLFSSGTPGANDVEGDPQFVDASRTLATWAASKGQASTTTAAINLMLTLNGADEVAGVKPRDALDWIRAGWSPRNQAFKNAAHDGTDIGAIPVSDPAPAGDSPYSPLAPSLVR